MRCLKTNKNEVTKKPKSRFTKGNIRVWHVRPAKNKNEVAKKQEVKGTEREPSLTLCLAKKRRAKSNKNEVAKKQKVGGTERELYLTSKPLLAKQQKGEKFTKKRSSRNNKNEAAKKQKVRSVEAESRLMLKKQKGPKKYAKWIPIPHTCDCYKMHLKFLENASKEKEELEADIDSDVA